MELTDRPSEPKKTRPDPDGMPQPESLRPGGNPDSLDLMLFTLAVATATLLTLATIVMQVL